MKKYVWIAALLILVAVPAQAGPLDVVSEVWTGLVDTLVSMVEAVEDALVGDEEPASFTEPDPPPTAEIPPSMDPNG